MEKKYKAGARLLLTRVVTRKTDTAAVYTKGLIINYEGGGGGGAGV